MTFLSRPVESVRGQHVPRPAHRLLGEIVARDARTAIRGFRTQRGFAATIVLTLALSIGAATTMFSIVKGLLLDPLPLANGDRLAWTVNHGTRPYDAISPADLADWMERNKTFEQVGSWLETSVNLVGGGPPAHLSTAEVTGNWFTMLGPRMTLGRGILSDDQGVGKAKVVVLSHALWTAQFGANPHVVGTTVLLDGTPTTVVGVAPPSFTFPSAVDIWRPVVLDPQWSTVRGSRIFNGPVVLLKRGVGFEEARSAARAVAQQMHADYPQAENGLAYDLQPFRDHVVGSSRRLVVVLFGAVALLLVIACVNVATLMLVRSSRREVEIGVRLALGATPGRVVVQLFLESLLLGMAGSAVGVALTALAVGAVRAGATTTLPLVSNVSLDWQVLAFAVGVALVGCVTFGLAPALKSVRIDIVDALRAGGRGAGVSLGASRARQALVALEIALVVPLLVGAVLLTRSLERLLHVDPGFRTEGVVRFDIALPRCGGVWSPDTTCAGVVGARYMSSESMVHFADELTSRLQAIPGTKAAIGFGAPFTPWAKNQMTIVVAGQAPPPADRPNTVESKWATPGYFATLGIPLLRGRDFNRDDRLGSEPVYIVSASAVKAYFGDTDPIGAHLEDLGQVIGVVGDTKTQALAGDPEPAVYAAFLQSPVSYMTVLLRSHGDVGALMKTARAQVASIDLTLPVFHMMPMQEAVDASTAPAQIAARVVGAFAAAALLLAIIGIYGVVAYVVRGRYREIAIRVALGARRSQVVRLVLRDALTLAAAGIVMGVGVSLVASKALGALLYDLPPSDVTTYVTATVSLVAVAILAAWLPARAAARIDPMVAMRPE